jgi:hypothetical protein
LQAQSCEGGVKRHGRALRRGDGRGHGERNCGPARAPDGRCHSHCCYALRRLGTKRCSRRLVGMRRLGVWGARGRYPGGVIPGQASAILCRRGRQRQRQGDAPRRKSERRQEPYPLRMRPDENRALRMDGWMDGQANRFIRPAGTKRASPLVFDSSCLWMIFNNLWMISTSS